MRRVKACHAVLREKRVSQKYVIVKRVVRWVLHNTRERKRKKLR